MDIAGLQATLRRFAADRAWEPFHSPKNLAMALMVEAAELAEIFQWMTPEQSREAHADAAVKQHIGEELADVLLYLVHVADKTEVDLDAAVADKLAKNARKYPTERKADLDRAPHGAGESAGPVTQVLLDYENVQPSEAELRALVPEASQVWVFHGPHQKKVAERFASYGDGAVAVPISQTGKNALDFHLSFYMGYIASRHPDARMVVVANDQGYSPMLVHAQAMGFAVRQLGYRPPKKAAPAKKRAPAKKAAPAAKKSAAKTAPAKSAAPKKAAPTNPPAPAKKAAARKAVAPAKKAVAETPVAEKPAVEKPVPAKKAAPAKRAAPRKAAAKAAPPPTPAPAPKPSATPAPTAVPKLVEALRKMGQRRPAKAAALRRTLKPLLGAAAGDDAVAAAFDALVASGVVAIGAKGEATYPLFT